MDSLNCSIDLRSFQALINGLGKNIFYKEESYSNDFLLEQLYGGVEMDSQDMLNEIEIFRLILKEAAKEDWDGEKLSQFLLARSFPEDHLKVFSNYWEKESSKIHQTLLKESTWNDSFDRLSWRVDVRSLSKNSAEINEPVGLFEFHTIKGHMNKKLDTKKNIAKFEMNKSQLDDLLANFAKIQTKFDELK